MAPVDKAFTGVSHFCGTTRLRMELNEPITVRDELQFCNIGNRLALDYLRICRDVLKDVAAGDSEAYLRSRISNALEALLSHTRHCTRCNED